MASTGGDLTLEFPTTLDDCAALLRYISWSPRRVLVQAVIFAGLGVYLMVMAFFIGLIIAGFNGQTGVLAAMSVYVTSQARDDLAPLAPWIGGFTIGVFLLNLVVLIPRQCRALARRSLGGYPEIPVSDPTMTLDNRVHLDPRGIEAATRDQRLFTAWPLIRTLVERKDHFFVMTSNSTAFMIPKRSLDNETVEAFRAYVLKAIDAPREVPE